MPKKEEVKARPTLILYIYEVCVSLSRLLNTLLGGNPKETLCSRTGRYLINHKPGDSYILWIGYYAVHRITHVFERNHVFKAVNLAEHRNNFIDKWDFAKHRK